jgi:3'-phosphoadenosine 5'-phosphosulfate sulfotransferase (PAPS reductase)/FAD synthetase
MPHIDRRTEPIERAFDDLDRAVYATVTFDVLGQRRDTSGARTVELPYYSTVMRRSTPAQKPRGAAISTVSGSLPWLRWASCGAAS